MKTGDIILVPFPFAELTNKKLRPAVVVCETKDDYRDVVACAVSSVVPPKLGVNQFLVTPTLVNKLRANSVVRVDRIVTVKSRDVIASIGKLDPDAFDIFIEKFKALVD